tara:strand:+ start:651 stop:1190 length:540 start_codon:yes stop_codon:yes gene_type:complete
MDNFNFINLPLQDAVIIETNVNHDERGIFSRFFCNKELQPLLNGSEIVNLNFSQSKKKGTLRGMHFQKSPYQEKKFVRCISGKIFDVIVDLRMDSPTYLNWLGVELNSENKKMIYIPEGFAHGYQTLEDNSEIIYCVTNYYSPKYESGCRFDDPILDIKWPLSVVEISNKDMEHPNLTF